MLGFFFRTKLRFQQLTWRRPVLYMPFGVIRGRGNVLDRKYRIVVDGFPRSGNTFFKCMFEFTQQRPLATAHRHSAPFLRFNLSVGSPTVVLVRDPMEAVISWSIFTGFPVEYTARQYQIFYEALMDLRSRAFIALFDEFTISFRETLASINSALGSGLLTDFDEEKARQNAFARIDGVNTVENGNLDIQRLGRPHQARADMKKDLVRSLSAQEEAALEQSRKVYLQFIGRESKSKSSLARPLELTSSARAVCSQHAPLRGPTRP